MHSPPLCYVFAALFCHAHGAGKRRRAERSRGGCRRSAFVFFWRALYGMALQWAAKAAYRSAPPVLSRLRHIPALLVAGLRRMPTRQAGRYLWSTLDAPFCGGFHQSSWTYSLCTRDEHNQRHWRRSSSSKPTTAKKKKKRRTCARSQACFVRGGGATDTQSQRSRVTSTATTTPSNVRHHSYCHGTTVTTGRRLHLLATAFCFVCAV